MASSFVRGTAGGRSYRHGVILISEALVIIAEVYAATVSAVVTLVVEVAV